MNSPSRDEGPELKVEVDGRTSVFKYGEKDAE